MRIYRQRDALSPGVSAYIGLGSNLHGPAGQIERAFVELNVLPRTRLLARSHLYRSRPLGPQDQPDYINAVAMLTTELAPLKLLQALRKLEEGHGRRRTVEGHWGARSLDLDILMYGDVRVNTPELTLPHPQMHVRSFVLYPLAELAPTLVIPGHGQVQVLRNHCHTPAIESYKEAANE
ncbi:MAG: 2-amino-4-hydroxy-6-hydroxymethyldihydropteridine diphosphokinase [Gammaproteobacteria bacterium]